MTDRIIAALRACRRPRAFPDGTPYDSLAGEDAARLAAEFDRDRLQIEISALENDVVPERYARNMRFLSFREQATLLRAHVAVVGLGGLGGGVTEMLARLGIGTLTLVDGDVFEESNLNRQFLSRQDRLGTPKSQAAVQRVRAINAAVRIRSLNTYIDAENAPDILSGVSVVVDCLDNIRSRFVLEAAAKRLAVPFVSAAVAGLAGQITTIFPEDPGLSQIYGPLEDNPPDKGAETALGTLPPAVTTVAALECSEVLKIILKKGLNLRNRLMLIDLIDNTFEVLQL